MKSNVEIKAYSSGQKSMQKRTGKQTTGCGAPISNPPKWRM
jgi:hypothetical protein